MYLSCINYVYLYLAEACEHLTDWLQVLGHILPVILLKDIQNLPVTQPKLNPMLQALDVAGHLSYFHLLYHQRAVEKLLHRSNC